MKNASLFASHNCRDIICC